MEFELVWLTILLVGWSCADANTIRKNVAEGAKIVNLTVSSQDKLDDTRRLDAYCDQYPGHGPQLDAVYSSYTIKTVIFHACIPTRPFADLLTDLEVSVEHVKELVLENLVSGPPLNGSYFARLDLKILQITGKQGENFSPAYNYLSQLRNLNELKLINVVNVPPLPIPNRLTTVFLSNGVSSGQWGGCDELESVTLNAWDGVPILGHCPNLRSVTVSQMTDARSLADIFRALPPTVSRLSVMLSNLPNLVLPNKLQLKRLEIKDSQLQTVDISYLRLVGHTLEFLDLSKNPLTRIDPNIDFPRLVSMNLENSGLNFCDNFKVEKIPNLKILNLRDSFLDRMCFAKAYNLTELNLSSNNIRKLDMNELPLAAARDTTLFVNLIRNPLTEISSFTEDMYHAMDQARKNSPDLDGSLVTLKTESNSISCSDQSLMRAVSQQLIAVDFPCGGERGVPGSRPEEGQRWPALQPEGHPGLPGPTEDRSDFACDSCVCSYDGARLIARCEDVRQIPRVSGLTELKARNNRIVSVSVDDLPASLVYLDLRGNRITSISEEVMKKLFSVENRNIMLAGNPIACNCDNQAMLAELHNFSEHVDYRELTCDGDEKHYLRRVNQENLCQGDTKTKDSAAGISSCMTLVAAAAYLVL